MAYPLGLVGEQHYQHGVDHCQVDMEILICHEHGNPYDAKALRAETPDGHVIGYVPKDSWVRRAIFDEIRGTIARVIEIHRIDGIKHVVLAVETSGRSVPQRQYRAP